MAVGAAALALGTTGIAYAQTPEPSIDVTAAVSPTKAGTKSKPNPEKFTLAVKNDTSSKTTAKSIKVTFPSTLKLATKGLPQCTKSDDALIADVNVCKSSIAGKGSAHALLNPFAPTPAPLSFKVVPVIGKNQMLFVLSGSASAVLHGKIKGSTMTIGIPPELKQPVPNTFSPLAALPPPISRRRARTGSSPP